MQQSCHSRKSGCPANAENVRVSELMPSQALESQAFTRAECIVFLEKGPVCCYISDTDREGASRLTD